MISEIRIQNFKSIQDLKLKLGRVTVLIGENGSGKSNILEAIAFAGCAAVDKLDNAYLAPRGIRVTEDTWMVSAFPKTEGETKNGTGMEFSIAGANGEPAALIYTVNPTRRDEDKSFLRWNAYSPAIENGEIEELTTNLMRKLDDVMANITNESPDDKPASDKLREEVDQLKAQANLLSIETERVVQKRKQLSDLAARLGLADFVIYAPENTVLRLPPPEAAIQPLGTKGEGLFRLLQSFTDEKFKDRLAELQSRLHLFGWFDEFLPPDDSATSQARLQIHDRWLAPDKAVFDQRSANEGFLFVLFYFTLLLSWRTPVFFAIDNIDTALNPKLCSILMAQIVELAKKYGKQVICTTHNPAILDGLNINDDEQRLYTVQRDEDGHTVVNRVKPPQPQPGKPPMKLSAAFLAGHIGGLPDHF
jgi:predicted ATPase